MIKQTYTFEELLPYLKPTEKYNLCLYDLEESDFFYHLKSDLHSIDHSKFGQLISNRVQEYPIFQSYCTDQYVGQYVYVMDGVVAWSTYQTGRKMGISFYIHNDEKYRELLKLARECIYGSEEETYYKDCDLNSFSNVVFVYEYAEQALPNDGLYAFMDNDLFIRKVVSCKRHPEHCFGSIITYIDANGDEVTETLEKSNGRMVGFKFQNSNFISKNLINKSIENFIQDGKIKTQFGDIMWSLTK